MANGFIGGEQLTPVPPSDEEIKRLMLQQATSPLAARALQSAGSNQFARASQMRPRSGLGALGQVLLGVGGLAQQDQARQQLNKQAEQAQALELAKYQQSRADKYRPTVQNVGGNLVQYDPTTQETKVLFAAPKPPKFMAAGDRVLAVDPMTGQSKVVYQPQSAAFEESLIADILGQGPQAAPATQQQQPFQAPPPILSEEEQETYTPGPTSQVAPQGGVTVPPVPPPAPAAPLQATAQAGEAPSAAASRLGISPTQPTQTTAQPTVEGLGEQYAAEGAGGEAGAPMVKVGSRTMTLDQARDLSATLKKGSTAQNLVNRAIRRVAMEPGKTGQNEIDKKILTSGERITRLKNLQDSVSRESLLYMTGVAAWGRDFADKFGGTKVFDQLFPGFKKRARRFYRDKSRILDNINRYIKEMTGAAMSQGEATRLRSVMPNLGDNPLDPFSGDGPTRFFEKLDDVLIEARRINARNMHLKRNGFTGSGDALENKMSLSAFDQMVNNRAKALRAQGMTDDQIKPQLKREFGEF